MEKAFTTETQRAKRKPRRKMRNFISHPKKPLD
jgi:hypothetical protein